MPLPTGATAFQAVTNNGYVIPASSSDPNSYWLRREGNDLVTQIFGQANLFRTSDYFPDNLNSIDFRAETQLVFLTPETAIDSSLSPPSEDQQKFNPAVTRVGPSLVAAWVSQYADGAAFSDRLLISQRSEVPYSGSFPVLPGGETSLLSDGPQLCALSSSSLVLHTRNITRIMNLRGEQHGEFGEFNSATTGSILACLNGDPRQLLAVTTAYTPEINVLTAAGTLVARINLPLPFSNVVGIYPLKDGGFVAALTSFEGELGLQVYSARFAPGEARVIPNAINPRMANSKASWTLVSWTDPESGHIQALSFNNRAAFGRQLDLGLDPCKSSLGVLPDGNILCVNILPGGHPLFRIVNGFTGIPQTLVQNLIRPPVSKPQLGTATNINFNTQADGEVNVVWTSGPPRPRQGIAVSSLPALAGHMSIVVPGDEAVIEGGFGPDQIFTNGNETIRTQGGQDIIFIPRAPNATLTIEDFDPSKQRINLFPFAGITDVSDLVIRQERASTRVELPDNQTVILQGASGITRSNFVFSSPWEELFALAGPNPGQNSSETGLSGGLFSTALSASASATASASGSGRDFGSTTGSNSGSAPGLSSSGTGTLFGPAPGTTGSSSGNQNSENSANSSLNPFMLGGGVGALLVVLACFVWSCVHHKKKASSPSLART